MTAKEKDTWEKRQDAEDAGFNVRPWRGVQLHTQNTIKHEFVKFALVWALDMHGHAWDTEVPCDTGRVDVFDCGPEDGRALVYEIETDVTPARAKEKVEQYCRGPVRDVLVIDPSDVPDELEKAIAYLSTHEVVG